MGIHYAFWNIMLLFPEAIKLFVEVLVVALFIMLFWPLDKYIIIVLIWIGTGLNYFIFGGIRFVLIIFPCERKYIWDEKIGKYGAWNNTWLRDKCFKLQKSKMKDIFRAKAAWIIVFFLYIVTILPFFHLEKYISECYINPLYAMNYLFVKMEAKLTTGIENYPPFWIRRDEEEALSAVAEEIQEEEEEAKEPIYLKLNENTSYANIRGNADIHSESICVVSNVDEILYQDIYEYDSERFWLKVVLPSRSNLEGWISANVIEPEIIANLDLQY